MQENSMKSRVRKGLDYQIVTLGLQEFCILSICISVYYIDFRRNK